VKVEVLNIDERGRYKLRRIEPEGTKKREPERTPTPAEPDHDAAAPRAEGQRPEAPRAEAPRNERRREADAPHEQGAQQETDSRRRRPHARKEDAPPPAVEIEPLQSEEESSLGSEDRW
jgi:hypothetical protein